MRACGFAVISEIIGSTRNCCVAFVHTWHHGGDRLHVCVLLAAAGSSCPCVGLRQPQHTPCSGYRLLWPSLGLPGVLQVGKETPNGEFSGNFWLVFSYILTLHKHGFVSFICLLEWWKHVVRCRRLQRPCPFRLGLAERGQIGWGQGVLNTLIRTLHPARAHLIFAVLTTVSPFMCWAVQCSNESVFGADFHPTDCNIVVTCGKSHLYFWNLEKGLLVKKQGLFEVGHQNVESIP